jgi:hypothetical protein
MRRTLTHLASLACAAGLAIGMASMTPAQAANPASTTNHVRAALVPLAGQANAQQFEEVQYRRDRRRAQRRDWRGPRQRHHRRHLRRGGPSIYFHFGTPRYHAPPPRRYVPPRRAHRLPAAHIRWCYNRYRSYRDWDNTFQPYHGPRRQCRSPYF